MSHTKEPWMFAKVPSGNFFIYPDSDENADAIAGVKYFGNGEANARRIVACVNACADIETSVLELGGSKTVLASMGRLTQQRDELIEQARCNAGILTALLMHLDGVVSKKVCDDIKQRIEKTNEAIAKVES